MRQAEALHPTLDTGRRSPARLELARDGSWFRWGDGDAIDLSRRRVLRNVLCALAEQRTRDPGVAARTEELFARAWPGQNIRLESARNRLYVAINALREMGLRNALVHRDGGYLIPPRVRVTVR